MLLVLFQVTCAEKCESEMKTEVPGGGEESVSSSNYSSVAILIASVGTGGPRPPAGGGVPGGCVWGWGRN
jgi:hypothetical protein